MEDKLVSGVFSGRPFGGTAIFVRSVFANRVSVVDTHNPRITAVRLWNSGQANMLICSVYMPWNDRSLRQTEEYEATLGCLQAIIDFHNGCSVVLGGDWNVAKRSNYPAESFVSKFCSDNNLQWLDHSNESVNFTYHCDGNNHFSLVDHFVCSSHLVDDTDKMCILVDGCNTSDHFAISVTIKMSFSNPHVKPNRVYSTKLRWDRADLSQYEDVCSGMLAQIHLPVDALLCSRNCCSVHNSDLEHYYNCIVECLLSASSLCVPEVKVGVEKHWWTPELEDLKHECIEQTNIWHLNGCPRSGLFNENRIKAKLRYKCAIKEAVIAADEDFNEDLVNHLCKKNFNNFWKAWRKRFCSKDLKPTSRLNSSIGDVNILAEFSNHFSQLGECNTPGIDDKYRSFVSEHLLLNSTPGQPVYIPVIDVNLVQDRIQQLKCRKAAGHDNILNEHLIYAGPNLAVHLCLLFSAMLRHSYVPSSFRYGIVKPILKNKHGDQTSIDMYRGITLTPVISKLFEAILLVVYENSLYSDPLQFGFKKNTSCSHALFGFTEAVNYYRKRGNKVFCAFLDASKAFDKVLLNGLLAKLIKRNVPLPLVRVLYNWFSGLSCSVVWNSLIGTPFCVYCGVRQGGVLSPLLFAIYVDDLISELRQSGYGLHIGSLFIGSILYADDIALLACSCYGLQQLINICHKYGMQWDIRFNPQKSQLACFGGNSPCDNFITLGNVCLCWSVQIKYLGCCFRGKQCAVDPSSFIGRFYGTFNNILNVMGNCRNEMSALHLVQTYCLPSLLYSCETWSLSSCDEKRVDVAWNNAFRKIFNAYWHESVKPLQYYCSCLPVSILLPMKKLLFWKKMLCSGNLILCRLAKCCDARIFALAAKYHIEPHDVVHSSVARIQDSFWFYFSELV